MELEALIEALSSPAAYPWHDPGAAEVEVIQTHISVVFLIGREVFKIHKPVDFGFLDFTTLEDRRIDCEAEVEVNRELASGVYRGVVAVVERDGVVQIDREPVDDSGQVLEWAVWMRRLPDSATFSGLLARGQLGRPQLWGLAATLVAFYRDGAERAAANPELARLGDLATVEENMRENFAQLDAIVDVAREFGRPEPIDRDLLTRLREVSEAEFERVRGLIRARFEAGQVRDTHGDLRLDHVYNLGYTSSEDADLVDEELLDATGRRELLIIDRIEFADRFRWSDPIADIAFLVMDLEARGAWQLARCFADDFISASDDPDVDRLLPFYTGYRATVRAKVAAMAASEAALGDEACAKARAKAEARARLALVELSTPRERPCMILVAGLPGTGKSMLARGLRETAGFTWIRADEVRKRLAGINPFTSQRGDLDEGIYTREWSDKTYAACLERAAEVCLGGGRALVDATFVDGSRREAFVNAAIAWGVPVHMLVVSARPELIKERLAARKGDPSDATWAIYQGLRDKWSPIDPLLCRFNTIDASGTPRELLSEAARALADARLA
ncbi:Zeta toxin [Enhygromyxa salina]|uniref:Zeta toxin n=1 Tax=Enhygromyxa salina TaxID=215803 RepID=A0A2S9YDE3_9BACT|nr:AAA family ATPase [Enhygromyxa salina]PRQ03036.1 Zeta toxin [Enhygromyxa salina]